MTFEIALNISLVEHNSILMYFFMGFGNYIDICKASFRCNFYGFAALS